MLFNMIGFTNFTLGKKYSVIQRKALSIRDILNAIDFTKVCLTLTNDVLLAIYHSI